MRKILLTLALLTCGVSARAESLQDAQLREVDAIHMADRRASNNAVAMNLAYVGSSTESTITVDYNSIDFYAPTGVLDSGVGTSGNIDLSATSYDTFGELCTYIDGLANYKCAMKDGAASDNTTLLRDQTATSGTADLKAAGGFDIKLDTGSSVAAYTDVYVERLGITPVSGRRVLLKQCIGNANVIGTCTVGGKLRKFEGVSDGVTRNDSTVVWSAITADDTDLTLTWSVTGRGGIEFAKDAHVVVSCGNGTGVQAAANNLQCYWEER